MRIEIDGDVAVVTLAVALRDYGMQLQDRNGVLAVVRGPDAAAGDQRVRAALAALRDREAINQLRRNGANV